MKKKEKTKR